MEIKGDDESDTSYMEGSLSLKTGPKLQENHKSCLKFGYYCQKRPN